jgi:hypothetical protein
MSNAQRFLIELYEIDPGLKDHEAELMELIEALLKHNPGIDPDERFVEMLRMKLRERAANLSTSSLSPRLAPRSPKGEVGSSLRSIVGSLFMPKFSYGIMGAILGIAVAVPAVYYYSNAPISVPLTTEGEFFAYNVTPVSNRAFGDLSTVQSAVASGRGGGGGGGGLGGPVGAGGAPVIDAAMPAPAQSEGANTAMGSAGKMMIAPPGDYVHTQYNYVFRGSGLTLPQGDVTVFKRVKGNLNLPGVNLNADLGIFSLSSFPGLKLETISAYQDTTNGYTVYVSAREGSVSIGQNWETWNHPETACRDEACYQRLRLKITDIPADEQIIAIADEFLKDHGFKLGNVGAPYIDNGWKMQYERMTNKADFYVPDQMSVIYPTLIEGQEVYEEFGGKTGVSVSIDIRNKKVAGVWNLFNQSYQSSTYPAVTSEQVVLDHLAKLDKTPTDWLPQDAKRQTLDVELGNPTMGYVHMYKYDNSGTEELYVPALVFPVTKQPTGKDIYFNRQFVTVPLAADLLRPQIENTPRPIDGPVRIMEEPMEGDPAMRP